MIREKNLRETKKGLPKRIVMLHIANLFGITLCNERIGQPLRQKHRMKPARHIFSENFSTSTDALPSALNEIPSASSGV